MKPLWNPFHIVLQEPRGKFKDGREEVVSVKLIDNRINFLDKKGSGFKKIYKYYVFKKTLNWIWRFIS